MSDTIMARKKTSIMVDGSFWMEWVHFVVDQTGSARKTSEEIEKAMREYLARHKRTR
jgi:hypothetical protein